MSQSGEEAAEKSHEPTPKRLEEARKRGELARPAEILTAAAYGGLLLGAALFGAASMDGMGTAMAALLERAHRLAAPGEGLGAALAGGFGAAVAAWLAPWLLLPLAAVILASLGTRSLVFAPARIAPKLSRISPLANAQQRFGADGLFEFLKSATKLAAFGLGLGLFLAARLPEILATLHLDPGAAMGALARLALAFLVLVAAISLGIGALDFLWQVRSHHERQKMTRRELEDEIKGSEGDPVMRQARRTRGRELAMAQMAPRVRTADVVITNPTHYAVALAWSREPGSAPVCVAKGTDLAAARIRTIAMEAGVPLHADPPVARALHASVPVDAEILPEHYAAVAAAIRYAEGVRLRARRTRR